MNNRHAKIMYLGILVTKKILCWQRILIILVRIRYCPCTTSLSQYFYKTRLDYLKPVLQSQIKCSLKQIMSLKGLKNPIRLPDKQKLFADLMSRFNNVRINKMITIWSSYFKFTEMSHYPSTLNNLSRHHFYTTTFLLVSQYVSRPANHTEHFMIPPPFIFTFIITATMELGGLSPHLPQPCCD